MKQKIVVGARYGLRDWIGQRATAVLMAFYTLVLLVLLVVKAPKNYFEWFALFSPLWMKIATLLFIASVLYHAWVGMRDIYMDYIKPTAIRLSLQVLTLVALAAYGLWALKILLQG